MHARRHKTISSRRTMTTEGSQRENAPPETRRPAAQPSRSLFSVPTPIKQLFDRFPILTYAANELPQRAPRRRDAHTLYVFASEKDAMNGAPSYNPGCLKWQVRSWEYTIELKQS
jgi:metaxin